MHVEPRAAVQSLGAAVRYTPPRRGEDFAMPTKRTVSAWLLVLICFASGLVFAQKKATLVGKIVDKEGKPIPGVTVTATSPEIPDFRDVEITNKRGMFSIDFRQIDVTYQCRFEKPGYQTMEVDEEWHKEGSQQFEWTMEPQKAAPPTPGALPVLASEPTVQAFNAGVVASRAKDYATAEAKFKEAAELNPDLRQAWEALCSVQVELKHNEDAARSAEKAIALGSTAESVYLARWQAYKNLNDEAKAAEALQDLDKVGRRTEEAKRLHNEGVALSKTGDSAGAFAKFQEALSVDPNLETALIGLATAGLKIGKYTEAATAAETILKGDPKNEAALRIRYNACLSLGDKERLVSALEGLAVVEPVIARDGILKLAFESYDAGDMVRAKERFRKVLALDPNHPYAHYYLALIAVGEGANADAKIHLQRFLDLAPNDPEAGSAREMLKVLNKS
jgi:Tfp pilus assembly protein PilF